LLSLPFVFKSAGWIGGVFATLTFSATTWRTSLLLGREMNGDPRPLYVFQTKEDRDTRLRKTLTSFPDIAREAFGQMGNIILSFVLYFELFSCLSIFLVTLGDHMHSLFPQISVAMHMFHISFALAVPTALLRTPRLLSYLSAVGTVATASVVLAVMLSSIYSGDISEELAAEKDIEVEHTHIYWDVNGLPLAFGLIAYTFSGHALIPSIYSSMAQPQDYEKMIRNTYFMVSGSCIIVACSGYYMFGSMVDDQVTLSLEAYSGSENVTMKVITWLMILTAFSKFTLSAFPLALGIEELFAPCVPTDYIMEWVSSIIKLVLIVSSLSVAVFCPSFSFLCSLVGLICTMIVSVIFPAAAHLKLFYNHIPLWEKVIDWLFIIGGTAMAIAGTYNQLK
jgi:vesicular inhibitory amino acid transporter